MKQKDTPTIFFGDTGDVSRTFDPKTRKRGYVGKLPDGTAPPLGRATKKDWVGVMYLVIAKVAKDGLPTGRGAQTELARWIHDALASKDMEASQSMVADHARLILAEVEKIR